LIAFAFRLDQLVAGIASTGRDRMIEGASMAGAVQPVKDRPEKAVAGHSVVSVA
jgi:hypothetical protein